MRSDGIRGGLQTWNAIKGISSVKVVWSMIMWGKIIPYVTLKHHHLLCGRVGSNATINYEWRYLLHLFFIHFYCFIIHFKTTLFAGRKYFYLKYCSVQNRETALWLRERLIINARIIDTILVDKYLKR